MTWKKIVCIKSIHYKNVNLFISSFALPTSAAAVFFVFSCDYCSEHGNGDLIKIYLIVVLVCFSPVMWANAIERIALIRKGKKCIEILTRKNGRRMSRSMRG